MVERHSSKSQEQELTSSTARTKQSEQEVVNTKSPPPVTYFLQQGSTSEKFYKLPDSIAKFKYGSLLGTFLLKSTIQESAFPGPVRGPGCVCSRAQKCHHVVLVL